jgi:transcription antitermination factor NusG
MRDIAPISSAVQSYSLLPFGSVEPRWYAGYTYPRHEKRVAEHLSHRSIEHFLPLTHYVSQWKDRQKLIQLPLFPGYIFVHLDLKDRFQVLEVPGVAYLVGFHGTAEPLPDKDIETLRLGLAQSRQVQEHVYVTAGQRARITSGPLAGLTGIVRRTKGTFRVILSVELIRRSLVVDVDASSLEYLVPSTT